MKHAKLFAIVAVAAFCVSAFAIAIDTSEDSSADGEKLTYSFYIELNNGTDTYKARLPDATVNGAEPSGTTYEQALTAAGTAGKITITFEGGYLQTIVADGKTYNASPYVPDWGTEGYRSFAVFYNDNGTWKDSMLNDSTELVIVFDEYKFSKPADESKYQYHPDEWGMGEYWTLLPTVQYATYKIYYELEDNDGSKFSKWTESKQLGVAPWSLASARARGAEAAGFELVNHAKYASMVVSATANGHTYTKHGSSAEDTEWAFGAYFDTGNGSWKDLQSDDMNTATTLCYVFNHNRYTDPQDSTYFHHEAVGGMPEYWSKLPSIQAPSKTDGGNNNLILYIGIGAVAVVAVVVIVFFLMKKKA